jgi:hypothetical protein
VRHGALRHTPVVAAAIVMVVAFVNLLSGGRNLVLAGITAAIVIALIILEVQLHRATIDRERGR